MDVVKVADEIYVRWKLEKGVLDDLGSLKDIKTSPFFRFLLSGLIRPSLGCAIDPIARRLNSK